MQDLPDRLRARDADGVRFNPEIELDEIVWLQSNAYQRSFACGEWSTTFLCYHGLTFLSQSCYHSFRQAGQEAATS
jgi:hypothetical protein